MPIQHLPKTPIQFPHIYSQYNLSKISPPIFPLGGDTPFFAFGYEIKDFYLTRKNTGRRYGRRLFYSIFKLFIHVCLSILQAAECNHAATNSVTSYVNKTHTYIRFHMATLFAYIFYTTTVICEEFSMRNA